MKMALNFLPQKRCVFLLKKNDLQPEPSLKLYVQQLPLEEKVKFIGVFFDRKLNFIPHIKYIKYIQENYRKAYYNCCALYPAGIRVVSGQPY